MNQTSKWFILAFSALTLAACNSEPTVSFTSSKEVGVPVPTQAKETVQENKRYTYTVQGQHQEVVLAYVQALLRDGWLIFSESDGKIIISEKGDETYQTIIGKTNEKNIIRFTVEKIDKDIKSFMK
jgi:hypothetical protein